MSERSCSKVEEVRVERCRLGHGITYLVVPKSPEGHQDPECDFYSLQTYLPSMGSTIQVNSSVNSILPSAAYVSSPMLII